MSDIAYSIRLPQGDYPLSAIGEDGRYVFDAECFGSAGELRYAILDKNTLQLHRACGNGHVPCWKGNCDALVGTYIQDPSYNEYNQKDLYPDVQVVEGTTEQPKFDLLDDRLAIVMPICESCPEYKGMKGTYVVGCRIRSGGCCGGVSVNHTCPKGYWTLPLYKANLFKPADLSRSSDPQSVKSLILSDIWPPEGISDMWQAWPNVQLAYRLALAEAPLSEIGTGGRGIVCPAGGRYFVSGYATIRAIRLSGCTLPIELWILPGEELSPWQERSLEGLDVTVRIPTIKIDGGWQLKYYAVLHSNFSEVLFLDADCWPLLDPTVAFDWSEYKETGCYLWLDQWKNHQNDDSPGALLPRAAFDIMGIPYVLEHVKDSGVMLIDKTRHHKSLSLANWMNQHWQYYYRENRKGLVYGDKDLLFLAMRYLGETYATSPKPWGATDIGGIHVGRESEPFFFHNFSYKFMLSDDPKMRLAAFPRTIQHDNDCDYPMKAEMEKFVGELRELRLKRPDKIRATTVCINYSDYLLETIQNNKHFDSWTIVTEAGDPVIKLAEQHGLDVLILDKKNYLGSKFNLGALRQSSFEYLANKYPNDFILSLDADVILPDNCREAIDIAYIERHAIYGATRTGDGSEGNDNEISGFFQLFHSSQVLGGRNYIDSHQDAGETDIWFRNMWRGEDRVVLPITVTHLGSTSVDWCGRVSFGPDKNAPATHDEALSSLLKRPSETPDLNLEPRWLDFFGKFIPRDNAIPPIHNRWSYARWIWKLYAKNGGTLTWDEARKEQDWPNSLIPDAASGLYGVPVKIFGLQRTGTNLAAWQVTRNFSANMIKRWEICWKHGKYEEDAWTDRCKFVLCVRHPLEQIASMYRYYCVHADSASVPPPQFVQSMTFADFCKSECYEFASPVERWNLMTHHWLDRLPADRTIVVRQEDQIDDQLMVLGAIHRHLGLARLDDSFTTSDSHIGADMVVTNKNPKNNPAEMFTPDIMDFVKANIDMTLLVKFGYEL